MRKTFRPGKRYRVIFRLPPFVPRSLVLDAVLPHARDITVTDLGGGRTELIATWCGGAKTVTNGLLESAQEVKP